MTEHAEQAAPRSRRRPLRAVFRFLDGTGPLIEFIGAVAGLILVTTLAIRAITGSGIGFF